MASPTSSLVALVKSDSTNLYSNVEFTPASTDGISVRLGGRHACTSPAAEPSATCVGVDLSVYDRRPPARLSTSNAMSTTATMSSCNIRILVSTSPHATANDSLPGVGVMASNSAIAALVTHELFPKRADVLVRPDAHRVSDIGDVGGDDGKFRSSAQSRLDVVVHRRIRRARAERRLVHLRHLDAKIDGV